MPFDPHLEEGAEISLERLKRETREALIELAAVVADGFPADAPARCVPLTSVVVAVAQPPQEVGIVVGADHPGLGTSSTNGTHEPPSGVNEPADQQDE